MGRTNSMFVGSTAGSRSRIADPLHHLHKKKEGIELPYITTSTWSAEWSVLQLVTFDYGPKAHSQMPAPFLGSFGLEGLTPP